MALGPFQWSTKPVDWEMESLLEEKEVYELLMSAAKKIEMDILLPWMVSKLEGMFSRGARIQPSAANELHYPNGLHEHQFSHWSTPSSSAECKYALCPLAMDAYFRCDSLLEHWFRNIPSQTIPTLKKLKELQIHARKPGCTLPDLFV